MGLDELAAGLTAVAPQPAKMAQIPKDRNMAAFLSHDDFINTHSSKMRLVDSRLELMAKSPLIDTGLTGGLGSADFDGPKPVLKDRRAIEIWPGHTDRFSIIEEAVHSPIVLA